MVIIMSSAFTITLIVISFALALFPNQIFPRKDVFYFWGCVFEDSVRAFFALF